MVNLFLLRHLKSQWNEEDRFAGWTDGPLSKNDLGRAKILAEKIFQFKIDKIYSSVLFRNMDTIARIMESVDKKYPFFIHLDSGKMKNWGNFTDISQNDIPVFISEKLNERYYGKLQGLNKKDTMEKFGEEKVRLWRRSYNIAPPKGESEKDVFNRTVPFFKKYVKRDLESGKNVLIVASHNPLRAIAKYVEKISDDDIINYEIEFGGLVKYTLGDGLKVEKKEII